MALDKLGLYNDACRIAGVERLADLTEAREARFKLDEIFELGAVDYCLRIAMPAFARKTQALGNDGASVSPEFKATHTLPTDFITYLPRPDGLPTLYYDAALDQPVARQLRDGDTIYTDYETVYIRYIFRNEDYATWDPEFVKFFTAYLGMELAERIAPHRYSVAAAKYKELLEGAQALAAIQEPLGGRAKASDVQLTVEWLPIYNDAAQILGKPHFTSIDDATVLKVMFDVARNSRLVDAMLEMTNWNWPTASAALEHNSRLEPQWGYQYTHEKPRDLHRLDGLFVDEMMQHALTRYQDEGINIYSNYQTVYIRYVSSDYLHNIAKWPAHFRRLVAGRLAFDVRNDPRCELDPQRRAEVGLEYEMRKQEAESVDTMQSPPIVISEGSWARSRYYGGSRSRDDYGYY